MLASSVLKRVRPWLLLPVLAACDDELGTAPIEPTDVASDDGGSPFDVDDAEWEIVFDDLDAALFSVWGTDDEDVWVVGADAGDGPLVMHYDGARWEVKDTGESGDLWWVSGHGDDVWMAGEGGLVLRYSIEDDEFERFEVPDPVTLFGIFPVAADDVWAVGGDFTGDKTRAMYRFDGDSFEEISDFPEEFEAEEPFFKVWGRSSEDLWVVGFGAQALHRVGEEWEVLEVPTGSRLFTVHGNDDSVAAVGGSREGLLLIEDDGEFEDVTPDGLPQMNGVWVADDGRAIAVGVGGTIYDRRDGEWSEIEEPPAVFYDYHAAFIDSTGGQWAVGGQVVVEPYVAGMLSHRGKPVSSEGVDDVR